MILVRDIFRFKFGQAKEPIGLWKQIVGKMRQAGWKARLMTDLVGSDYYTMVLESTWESLAEWEKHSTTVRADAQWRAMYEKVLPYTETGQREIMALIEQRFCTGYNQPRMNRKPAIVLTSGGLDSTTCLAIAKHDGHAPLYCLTFDYGQRHRQELVAAAMIAKKFAATEQRVIRIDLRQFGKSALTDSIDVPKNRNESEMSREIPITYVPARNTIFLSYALAWAEVLGVRDVFLGVNAVDYSGYPDCRPEFIVAFEAMANLATKMTTTGDSEPFRVHTPLIQLSKSQIIRRGIELGVDYSMTHSCYDPDAEGRACGQCDSCLIRKRGFAEAGVADPMQYQPI